MSRQQVTLVNDSPVLLLSPELMEKLGISIGDELELAVENRTLIVRPLDEVEREAKMDAAMKDLMERRREVYEKLAEGAK
ncbi:MAG TPA: AbrB/MazE/SpoVT family DNA-binding domain-containing protein [Blastocatellia bacterium]|nr:AbrB/MazE/SpoVT family DNA-binding domain-containing protein [Blastocatellia bacterium]